MSIIRPITCRIPACSESLRRSASTSPPQMARPAVTLPACNGSFSQNVQRLALYAEDSWRVIAQAHRQLRLALPDHLRAYSRLRAETRRKTRLLTCRLHIPISRAFRMTTTNKSRLAWGSPILAGKTEDRDPRRLRAVLRRSRAKRWVTALQAVNQLHQGHASLRRRGQAHPGVRGAAGIADRSPIQNALCHPHHRRRAARFQRPLDS